MPTPSSHPGPYAEELALALRTVHAASRLTKDVLRSLQGKVDAETKADDSPVTIADFAAQSLIIGAVRAVFHDDVFVGEESAAQLRENDALAERVWGLVEQFASKRSDVQHVPEQERGTAQSSQEDSEPLALPKSKNELLDLIDLGQTTSLRSGRVWVLDPVDGTATFMKGQQYAVALCLVVDGEQQVGVIGCPNLKVPSNASGELELEGLRIHEDLVDETSYGIMLSAVKGQGTQVRAMHSSSLSAPQPVSRPDPPSPSLADLNFVEAALGSTSLVQTEHQAVATTLGVRTWPGTTLWSQQMKYAALTLGAANVMLRIPKTKERYTMVWDHAGGNLCFIEAGGIAKDFDGEAVDFGQGRYLRGDVNHGLVATRPWCFDRVLQATKEVLERRTT